MLEQRRRAAVHGVDQAGPPLHGRHRPRRRRNVALPACAPARRQEIGHALDAVHQQRLQPRPVGRDLLPQAPIEPGDDEWKQNAGKQEEQDERQRQRAVESGEKERDAGRHENSDQRRAQAAHVKRLQGRHVADNSAEQVAAAVLLQAGRRQRLQRRIERYIATSKWKVCATPAAPGSERRPREAEGRTPTTPR